MKKKTVCLLTGICISMALVGGGLKAARSVVYAESSTEVFSGEKAVGMPQENGAEELTGNVQDESAQDAEGVPGNVQEETVQDAEGISGSAQDETGQEAEQFSDGEESFADGFSAFEEESEELAGFGTDSDVMAEETNLHSGTCGADMKWHITGEQVLVISGSGAMEEYSLENGAPWQEYADEVRTIRIEEGIEKLGEYAFDKMEHVTEIAIPASVLEIEDGVFRACTELERIDVAAENPAFAVYDGVLYSGDRERLLCYPQQLKNSSYRILPETTGIARYAFYGQDYLETLYVTEDLMEIGDNAFAECTCLNDISL